MRLLVLSNLFPPKIRGGYELLCEDVASELVRRGHEVTVLTTPCLRDERDALQVYGGLRLYASFDRDHRVSQLRRAWIDRHNRRALREAVRRTRPDLVFCWSLRRVGVAPVAEAQRIGLPTAFALNDDWLAASRRSPRALIPWTRLRRSAAAITPGDAADTLDLRHATCISHALRTSLASIFPQLAEAPVIHQGVSLERFWLKPNVGAVSTNPRLLYAGQLDVHKGVETAIEALVELPKARLQLVGPGSPARRRQLLGLVERLGLGERVELLGARPRDEVATLMRHADIALVTSRWDEPFGLTPLEAMASGTPLVSTTRGGLSELIVDGENGLSFPAGDARALAERVFTLSRTPGLGERLARAARQLVEERFSISSYCDGLCELLEESVARGRLGRRRYLPQVPRRYVASAWGGTETQIEGTTRALRSRGYEAEVVTSAALAEPGQQVLRGVPVRRHRYLYPFWGLAEGARHALDLKGGNLFSVGLLVDLLAGRQPALIHAHSAKRLGGIVRVAAKLRGVPYVVSVHGGNLDVPAEQQQQLVEPLAGTFEWGRVLGALLGSRRVFDDAAAIICVGREEQRLMRERYPGKRVAYLPNGVDAARFAEGVGPRFRELHGIPAEAPLVLCVGRLDPQKDQASLIRAVAAHPNPKAQLALIGPPTDPAYAATLREDAARLLPGRCTLLEGLDAADPQLLDAYVACDVFALPSRHEPFGIVILEAWAAGKAVVASRVGGIPGFVREGEDVLLVPPGDSEALTGALARLDAEPQLAQRLALAGRQRAREEFDWSVIADRLLDLYQEVCA